MNKRKILSLAMALSIVAIMAVGATLAYFTDTESATNVFTVGNVSIEQIEQERDADGNLVTFTQDKPFIPAVGPVEWDENLLTWKVGNTEKQTKVFAPEMKNVLDKFITVKNTGKSDAYVRTIIALESSSAQMGVNVGTGSGIWTQEPAWKAINVDGKAFEYSVFTYALNGGKLAAGETTPPSLQQVYLNKAATNEQVASLGKTFEIYAISEAVQADGFANAEAAFAESFGVADDTYVAGVIAKAIAGSDADGE